MDTPKRKALHWNIVMRIRNMKLRYKMIIATAGISLIAAGFCFEALSFFGGGTIRKLELNGSTKLSILTDGFQDRTSYVYLNSTFWLPKFLFSFDPYEGGSYSLDVSKNGEIVRFQQGNKTRFIHLQDATVTISEPAETIVYSSLIPKTSGCEVIGNHLWGFQSLFYRQ